MNVLEMIPEYLDGEWLLFADWVEERAACANPGNLPLLRHLCEMAASGKVVLPDSPDPLGKDTSHDRPVWVDLATTRDAAELLLTLSYTTIEEREILWYVQDRCGWCQEVVRAKEMVTVAEGECCRRCVENARAWQEDWDGQPEAGFDFEEGEEEVFAPGIDTDSPF